MSIRVIFDRMPNYEIRRIGTKVKEIKVQTMGITTKKVVMFEMENTTVTTTFSGVIMEKEMIGLGPMLHLKIRKFLLGMVEVV